MAKKGRRQDRGRPAAARSASATSPTPATRGSDASRTIWLALALAALTLIVFAPVRHFDFVNWDDPEFVTANAHVLAGLTWANLKWAATAVVVANWHPLTLVSHMLDVEMFGSNAGLHHVTSLLLHVATTVLLFGFLRTITGAVGRSAFVAALFAIHPVHVESVAWIAERKDVLSTFFWVLTLWAYVFYLRRPHWSRYLGMTGLFALALMSKPMVVTLPLVLLLLDVWPLERVSLRGAPAGAWRRVLIEKVPLLAMAMLMGVLTIVIQTSQGTAPGLTVVSWQARLSHALIGYVAYLGKAMWPVHLAAYYPPLPVSWPLALAAAVVLAAITAAVLRAGRRDPFLLIGWLWYMITLAPVIGIVQSGQQGIGDRYLYVPLIGLLIMVAWGVPAVVGRWTSGRLVLPVAATLTVLGCAVGAWVQVQYWSTSVTLWQHGVSVMDDYLPYEKLGEALRDRGQLAEAQADFSHALTRVPADSPLVYASLHNNLGLVLASQGQTDQAIAEFELAVHFNPAFAEGQSNLGSALAAKGRLAEAIEHYQLSLALAPASADAHVGLAGALLTEGLASQAMPHYAEAVRLDPGMAEAHGGLGATLAEAGQERQAQAEYQAALRLKPDLASAHVNLAALLTHQGKTGEAIDQFQRALEIEPGQAVWHYDIALLLMQQGKTADARQHLELALRIDPALEAARQALKNIR